MCELIGLGSIGPQQSQLFRWIVGGGSVREVDDHAAARDALHAQYVQRLSQLCSHHDLGPGDQEKDEARESPAPAIELPVSTTVDEGPGKPESLERDSEASFGDKGEVKEPNWDEVVDLEEYRRLWVQLHGESVDGADGGRGVFERRGGVGQAGADGIVRRGGGFAG